MSLPMSPGELAEMAVELVRRNGYREDVYVRPVVYKASPVIRVGLLGLVDGFCCFTAPMGDYHDIRRGLSVTVSGWRRNDDNAIPPRAKATGGYLNAALAVADAQAAGYDEAILLTRDGHVSEASAANLFLVREGTLITPDETSDILPGITRQTVMELAGRLGVAAMERTVDRTELYLATEMFLCGTGVQIAPITSIDGRAVGTGDLGAVTRALQERYLAAVRGDIDEYRSWLTSV
jgi:branched-chain amino acid aminotransferase